MNTMNRREILRGGMLGFGVLGAATVKLPCAGAEPRADEGVSRTLAEVRDKHRLPGLVGAVIRGGTIASIGAVGVRKVGDPRPIQPGDQVHLGSDTKAMTATMVGTLVDEGKLGWATTVREVFAARAADLHRDFQGVTLWELLTHRAGLPANGPWRGLKGKTTTEQRRDLLARMMSVAPVSPPGTKFAYSNVGYALAGLMAEEVTGRSWETLMRERLFTPLQMASAGFGPPGTVGEVDQPWGHRPIGKIFLPAQADNAPALGPAGTVHCTMGDWARFAGQHMREAKGGPRLLKPDTLRKLHTPPKGETYAGGWIVVERPWAGGPALTHAGSNTMWFATIWVAPVRNFAIAVATNAGGEGAQTACDEAVGALIKHHLT
ncbi:MAG: serine hydrolase [Isosphaeraceae bacterium]|nr:serine hydrolase [Isosphaeraceae bacterium]